MLSAICENKKYISYRDYKKILTIKKLGSQFICPHCFEELIFVNGVKVITHFRHKIESNCSSEPETPIHLEMKSYIKEFFNLTDEEIEYTKLSNKGFKPDGFIIEKNIALEVQHSITSKEEFIQRNEKFSKNNISVLWIFDKEIVTENPSAMIRKAHEIYFGRVYAYDKNIKKIIPIHFHPTKRWIPEFNGHGGYYKFYKTRKILQENIPIKNNNLINTKNNWKSNNFLISMFTDKKFWEREEKIVEPKFKKETNICECGNSMGLEYSCCYECFKNSGYCCPECGGGKSEEYDVCYNCSGGYHG